MKARSAALVSSLLLISSITYSGEEPLPEFKAKSFYAEAEEFEPVLPQQRQLGEQVIYESMRNDRNGLDELRDRLRPSWQMTVFGNEVEIKVGSRSSRLLEVSFDFQ